MHTQLRPALGGSTLLKTAKVAPLLTPEIENRLALEAQAGSQRAFDQLLMAHLRLVLALARRFTVDASLRQDLVGEGMLGLVEAARRFDPKRGARLSTYATWWIHAYMRRHVVMHRRVVRAPSSRRGRMLLTGMRTTQRELAQRNGVAPNSEETAAALCVDVQDIEEVESALSRRDVPYGVAADGCECELPSEDASPEGELAQAEELALRRRKISRGLALLDPRDRWIVEQCYLGGDVVSVASVARKLGLSRERVRQLNVRACKRMRHAVPSTEA